MKINKLSLISFLLTLSIFVALTSLTIPVYAQEDGNTTDSEESKLFAIKHAQSGSISKVNTTTNFLESQNVSNPILFSDRPDRIVKTESTQEFLDRWYNANAENNRFFLDPPNAALVIDDQEGQDEVVIELFEPA